MSTPFTFKRAICRSAAEVKSKEDKIVLVLLALNYSCEIEKDSTIGNSEIEEYYDILKDGLYSGVDTTEQVVKAVNLDFPFEETIVSEKSLVEEIKENPAPVSASIDESSKSDGKYANITGYDWNDALSNSDPVTQAKTPESTEKLSKASPSESRKVSPIPDAILYGDLAAYGIPNLERIKLVSQMGDSEMFGNSNSYANDHVYDIGLVPRSFKLGNREAVQHVNEDVETKQETTSETVVETETTSETVVEAEVTEE